jgi:transposase-like protein
MEREKITNYVRRSQSDYSLAFKLQVVDEVEKGEHTYKQAQMKYGIQGRSTVLVWLRKYGRLEWKESTDMKKNTPNKKIKELEKKIRRLEAEKEILNIAIDVADSQFNTNIRKKYLSLLQESAEAKAPKQTEAEQDTPSNA